MPVEKVDEIGQGGFGAEQMLKKSAWLMNWVD